MVSDFEVTEYGLMSPLLEVSVLSDLCVSDGGVQTGPFGSLLHKKDYVDKGTPIITVEHLGENRIIHSNTPYVSDADKERLSKYSLQTGDIVFSRVGSVDRRSLVRDEEDGWLFSGRCLRVRANKQLIDPAYLSYFFGFEGFKNHIRGIAVGATMPSINTKILSDIRIFYPKLEEQKAIAHILGTLDDKIELNRQMSETLEAMAQALFKSWFLDFDPVIDNALLAGKAIPEPLKERAELRQAQLDSGKAKINSEINDLFPSEFEFTEELGWIPQGWEVFTLDDITTELRRGISPKYTEENGIRVVNQRCIRNHTIDFAVCRLNDPSLRKVEGRLLEIGDVLVNSTGVGTLGRMAQVYELEENTVVDSHVTVVRPDNSKVEKYYFGRLMLSIEPIVESMGQGSTGQTELSRKHLGELSVCLPPSKIQKLVEGVFFSYAEKVNFNLGQSETLAKLRDTLLPKLMSGELRIADAKKIVEDI